MGSEDSDSGAALERRVVVLGKTEGSRVRITDGLGAGERVVKGLNEKTTGELREGLRVTVAN